MNNYLFIYLFYLVFQINNHFTIPIKIYRVKPRNHDFILVGTAQPEKVFHMPLHAIYSELKFLYFSIEVNYFVINSIINQNYIEYLNF